MEKADAYLPKRNHEIWEEQEEYIKKTILKILEQYKYSNNLTRGQLFARMPYFVRVKNYQRAINELEKSGDIIVVRDKAGDLFSDKISAKQEKPIHSFCAFIARILRALRLIN